IEDGIEGMVHVSEMSWTRRVRHPNEVLALDEEVDVMILSVDPEAEKIALGVKQTMPNPWTELEKRYPVGSSVKGIVRNLTDYGAFVQIEEGIDGLLHVSDLSWTKKVAHPSEVLEKGQEVEVKILSIDPTSEKVSVGLKQLEQDPWVQITERYPLGAHVEVEIAKLVSFGAFARLESGIEGLIHVSELADSRVQKPEDVLAIGDKVKTKVISIDPVERKIGLSIREYQRDLDMQAQREYGESDDQPVSVGDMLGDAVPRSMLQAGRSFTDVANEMIAAVNAQLAASGKESEESEQPVADQAESLGEGTESEDVEQSAAETPSIIEPTPLGEAGETPADGPVREEVMPEAPAEEPVAQAQAEEAGDEEPAAEAGVGEEIAQEGPAEAPAEETPTEEATSEEPMPDEVVAEAQTESSDEIEAPEEVKEAEPESTEAPEPEKVEEES
ncbi:MAG TPA: S1 RNA-binding domain-containing protein, partial [Candidatus Hydrogenedentes bacterium]|nr:S1 RNA-binding domain-containing protein [Candidatus Hydrogenedentota bacterium]